VAFPREDVVVTSAEETASHVPRELHVASLRVGVRHRMYAGFMQVCARADSARGVVLGLGPEHA